MILVRNRLLPLSGNRWCLCIAIILLFAACSPRVRTVAVQPQKKQPENTFVKQPEKIKEKPAAPRVSTVALLLPFGLEHIKPGAAYTAESLKEADIALAYYNGFKLALDSLTAKGYNYKLLVFDSKQPVHNLAVNAGIKSSNLIVGPVFPDEMKAFMFSYVNTNQVVVSPLSPASPASFKNPNLVTVNPPLEYHAFTAAKYINDKVKPQKVFILKSGYSDENDYITPFKKAIDSLSKKHIQVIALTVVHGQLNALIPQLSPGSKNIFIVPATNQHFLTVTLRALDTLNNSYPLTVFGHPNWVNFSFLPAALLQRLDTHITCADNVDYKAATTIAFMRKYSQTYHTMPGVYAIKGFDEGLYFGTLLATDSLKNVGTAAFTGLHNSFQFQKKAGLGYVNTHVSLFKYANFELKKVE